MAKTAGPWSHWRRVVTLNAMLRRLLSIALGAVLLAGCGGSEERTAPRSGGGGPLEGRTLDGDMISLADFRGTPVFVNVWSSW
jgi:hypothetical protein